MKGKATALIDRQVAISPKFTALLKVYEVAPSKRFPQGIKAKFVLLDLEKGEGRFLIDNHEPFGFHMHPSMSGNHDDRVLLDVKGYEEALEVFFSEVERILSNE